MRVLGIDPGIANVGFGLIDSRAKRRAIIFGTLRTNPRTILQYRIYSIAKRIDVLLRAYEPDVVAMEDFVVGYKRFINQTNANNISKVFGAIVYVVNARDIELKLYQPNVWMRKYLRLTPHAKFSKLRIKKTVDKELGVKTTIEHEAEALALALTHLR